MSLCCECMLNFKLTVVNYANSFSNVILHSSKNPDASGSICFYTMLNELCWLISIRIFLPTSMRTMNILSHVVLVCFGRKKINSPQNMRQRSAPLYSLEHSVQHWDTCSWAVWQNSLIKLPGPGILCRELSRVDF